MPSLRSDEHMHNCERWKYGLCPRTKAPFIVRSYYSPLEKKYCHSCIVLLAAHLQIVPLYDKSGRFIDSWRPSEDYQWLLEDDAYEGRTVESVVHG